MGKQNAQKLLTKNEDTPLTKTQLLRGIAGNYDCYYNMPQFTVASN